MKKTTKTLNFPKILVPLPGIRKLMIEHHVSKVSVYAALKYASNSPRAQAIRKDALDKYGGVEVKVEKIV